MFFIVKFCYFYSQTGRYSLVDRALWSKSKGLGFNSHCWPCIEVYDTLLIPYCLCQPSSDASLMDVNCRLSGSGPVHTGTCMMCVLYSSRVDEIATEVCPVPGKLMVCHIWHRYQILNKSTQSAGHCQGSLLPPYCPDLRFRESVWWSDHPQNVIIDQFFLILLQSNLENFINPSIICWVMADWAVSTVIQIQTATKI